MGRVSFESYASRNTSKTDRPKVGYFKLNDDGDYAIVRFAYESEKDFDIVDVHTVKDKDGRVRNISCLRESFKEPKEKCPLCVQGEAVKTRFFVKMITYTKDESGKIVVTPVVWERPAKQTVAELKSKINDYGDLRECVFKITRSGGKFVKDANGKTVPNKNVSYSINFQNPMIYKEELGFVKDFSAFDDFDMSKHSYCVRTAEELEHFIATGDLSRQKAEEAKEPVTVESAPAPVTKASVDENGVVTRPETKPVETVVMPTAPVAEPTPLPEMPVRQPAKPVETTTTSYTDPTSARPRRTYDWQKQ